MSERGEVVAWQCQWGGACPDYHDEFDPIPKEWDGPPDVITPLVRQSDYLALREELAEANESLARLTGMKFSDRMLAALVSRAQSAEAELAALKESAARIERECREAWRQAAHWKSMAAKVGTRINA